MTFKYAFSEKKIENGDDSNDYWVMGYVPIVVGDRQESNDCFTITKNEHGVTIDIQTCDGKSEFLRFTHDEFDIFITWCQRVAAVPVE